MTGFKFFRCNDVLRTVQISISINSDFFVGFIVQTYYTSEEMQIKVDEIINPFRFEKLSLHTEFLIHRKIKETFGNVIFNS